MDTPAKGSLAVGQDADREEKKNESTTAAENTLPSKTRVTVTRTSCKKHGKARDKNARSKKSKKPKNIISSDTGSSTSTSESETGDADETISSSEPDNFKKLPGKKKSNPKKNRQQSQKRKSIRGKHDDTSSTTTSSTSDSNGSHTPQQAIRPRKSYATVVDPAQDIINSEIESYHDPGVQSLVKVHVKKSKRTKKKKAAPASKVAFKRVDQLWDNAIHDYTLTATMNREKNDKFDKYIFTVRRKFDWEHKYLDTTVDIRSKPLREALMHVMGSVKTIALNVAVPKIEPNMLFLYLEEMRTYMKELKAGVKSGEKNKSTRAAAVKAKHLKIMIEYLDTDFADMKKTLYPMLKTGTISFDLLWALWKPDTIAYSSTYGDTEEPRAFKIVSAGKTSTFQRGSWYSIEGKYLEYTGKTFGIGTMHTEIDSFKGPRSITSLPCYPLRFHKDSKALETQLIERGKKFVMLKGMNYRHHQGMAYVKKKRQVLKVSVNGRVMVDPTTFRRINPNYMVGTVKPKEVDIFLPMADAESCNCSMDESDDGQDDVDGGVEEEIVQRKLFKMVADSSGRRQLVEIQYDENGEELKQAEKLDNTSAPSNVDEDVHFTDEELLIASPVVLGFSFNEKLWLEFSVSGIGEVQWNEGAFDSLVLPANQKRLVKAMVSSHKFHPSKNIDDVIANKGLGCTMVLHGPPGTGKTLTAEGIAELLKAPLYMVSAGELGTDPRTLERELQNILDIAHSWGAILLLDEADVFLEKRSLHDIHRNSLVGIFLRLLEYFQGILFLTTNRVETFDDAFQSRIHVALRYGELDFNAKKQVWKMFIEKIAAVPGNNVGKFDENDFDRLARRGLNGRQIKNTARAAQALAVHEEKPLSMVHVEEVLRVAQSFEQDLKGGTGYEDAMRSYT
ncbi:putative aaa family atpase [Phaeomoniella chlamydospora]|uniref:Putative aaa family atpase n=1 Tax=Phaeomoniella chlamydospora TaxID=158046 RepID=A0A0G2GNZ4_PHACM|nr:putative aaa family atpase [Phaeomoniella chlamydospora]